ncbi:phosphatidylserine/phosphatidylglycerophosphate/cardiolipin synthase family protein [Halobium salinum]|uniref:Phosphatidylserine/phosphatidylglycerophosphate/ cardiolipin synthase family protein n=1 Tax=Halobium salinum TaxID=1364940 RepID=A0ABD5P8C8_9EURY|nr:phospholipase D-like domain-containing protein [Halobium salinum]
MSTIRPALVAILAALLVVAAVPVADGVAAGGATTDGTATDGTTVEGSTANGTTPNGTARIVAVYPNPVADGDRGESVTLVLPGAGNWSVSDGETVVRLANRSGRVVVGTDPDVLRNRTAAGRVHTAPAGFGLANGGERLELRRGSRPVDSVVYEAAPEGERWHRNATPPWRPVGYTPREPVDLGAPNATAFVLPDSPEVAISTLRSADERLLLGGYTLASSRVSEALVAAAERGVRVRVLLEADPVGGLPRREAHLLDRLAAAGVEVRVLGRAPERFAFHHPKYAVVDDRALVLTENWKPAGTGGRSSRGWGVRLDGERAATELAALFRADANGTGAVAWERYREGRAFEASTPANGSFSGRAEPRRVRVEAARLLTAPGNAESAVVDVVERADDRVVVVQPTVGGPEQAMLRACVRAARRGVDVRILLSRAWYVVDDNRRLADRLNGRAEREGIPLEVRVAEPTDRFEKIHAKGVVADDTVVVGSLNWNENSATENREVAVALRSEAAAEYYRSVFEGDWQGGEDGGVPVGTLVALVVAAGGAIVVARRRVSFVGAADGVEGAGVVDAEVDGDSGGVGEGGGFDFRDGVEDDDGDGEN